MPPVVVLFWLANGLNLTQVMLLQSWFAIIIALLELPSPQNMLMK